MKALTAGVAAVAALAAAQNVSLTEEVLDSGIPNHVSIDESSPHFWRHFRNLGVMIDGEIRQGDVHEFNVAEGWAMVRQRNGIGQFRIDPDNTSRFLLERIEGKIEPYLKRPLVVEHGPNAGDLARMSAAAAKRARKAAKLRAQVRG
jgi:hypothetical protein